MTAAVTPYRHFDKQGYPTLLDPYIMAYEHWDGFSERLLHYSLLVNKDFHVQLTYHSYKWNGMNGADFNLGFSSSNIPDCLQTFLLSLNSVQIKDLKKEYVATNIVADDIGSKAYLFKVDGITKYIGINMLTPLNESDFEKPIEKDFFALHQMIEQWTSDLYDTYERLCAIPQPTKNKKR